MDAMDATLENLNRFEKAVPENLKGLGIDWRGFEPNGGWKWYWIVRDELVPEYKKANAVEGAKLKAHAENAHTFTEVARQSKDLAERFERYCALSQRVCGLDGKTKMLDLMDELAQETRKTLPDPSLVCDLPIWMNSTRTYLSVFSRFTDHALKSIEAEEVKRRKVEQNVRVGEAMVAFLTNFLDSSAYIYGIWKLPTKYRTKALRDHCRILKAAVEAIAVIRGNPDCGFLKRMREIDKERSALDAVMSRTEACYADAKRLKKLVEADGDRVWMEYDNKMTDKILKKGGK